MPELSEAELQREAIVVAQRIRICELEYELRQARELAAKAHTDTSIIRAHVARHLTGCVPSDTLGLLVKALDVVLVDLLRQRDQLHVAVQRPLPPPESLPDNVVQLRRVQAVGKIGPWRDRQPPLLPPAAGITAVHDDGEWSTARPRRDLLSLPTNPTE